MNIRLGIYEIFSRIVPGGVYMAAILQLGIVLHLVTLDWQIIKDIPLIASLGLIVVAYIIAAALNPYSFAWVRLFRVQGSSEPALTSFKKKYQDDWDINIEDKDWPVLLALIRTKDLELAGEVERHLALSIMMRNVSLGMGMMALNFLIAFAVDRHLQDVLAAVVTFVLSILVLRESSKFRLWYYNAIIETTMAYRINLETMLKPKHSTKRKSNEKLNTED
jgi:hypothetical protein